LVKSIVDLDTKEEKRDIQAFDLKIQASTQSGKGCVGEASRLCVPQVQINNNNNVILLLLNSIIIINKYDNNKILNYNIF